MMTGFNITNEQDVTDFASVLPKGCVLVVDTLNASAVGIDENGSVGMGLILAGAKRLAQITGGLVVLIHHSGKSEGAGLRGHSSLIGALDCALFVSRKAGRCTWTTDINKGGKSKDGAGVSHTFELDVVTLTDGSASCVVNADARTAAPMPPRLSDALKAFGRVAVLEGDCVPLEAWRAEFYTTSAATTPHAKKQAFQRARDGLVSEGLLVMRGDFYHQATEKPESPTSSGSTAQGGSKRNMSR